MEQITESIQGAEVYTDNFLVNGKVKSEYDKNLQKLLEKLQINKRTLNQEKYTFAQQFRFRSPRNKN